MSIISILKTPDYSAAVMADIVERHFAALGIENDLRPDMRVTVKPNLLAARSPETATTTNPALVRAVIDWLRARGITNITVADSPAGPFTPAVLKSIYNVCGLADIPEMNTDTGWQTVQCPDGFKNRTFNIINPIADADFIINLPKLKTHGMTVMSGAVKNMFGSIPGLQKPEMHYKWPEQADFCHMLAELTLTVKPAVALVDAVDGMEGNGPNSGDRIYTGVTFASRDPFTLDRFMADFIELGDFEMMREFDRMGLIKTPELVGDDVAHVKYRQSDARPLDFTAYVPKLFRKPAKNLFKKLLKPLPKVDHTKCIGCGKCAESCPPHIIKIRNRKAHFTSKGCISCFCCQEMCPVHAIGVKRRVGI